MFLFQFLFNAVFIFDTAADPVDRTELLLFTGLMVQDLQPREDEAERVRIRMDQRVILFFCHLYHTPFSNREQFIA